MGKESSKPGKGLCVCQNADLQFLAMDFVGFLFGNVNSDGELEDENVLDKVRIGLSYVVITRCPAQLSEVFSNVLFVYQVETR